VFVKKEVEPQIGVTVSVPSQMQTREEYQNKAINIQKRTIRLKEYTRVENEIEGIATTQK